MVYRIGGLPNWDLMDWVTPIYKKLGGGARPSGSQSIIKMIFASWSLGDRSSPDWRIAVNPGLTGLVSDLDWPDWDHQIGFACGSIGLKFSSDWRIEATVLSPDWLQLRSCLFHDTPGIHSEVRYRCSIDCCSLPLFVIAKM